MNPESAADNLRPHRYVPIPSRGLDILDRFVVGRGQRQMGEKLYCKTVFQFSNPLVALQFQGVRLKRASRIWLLPVWPICYPIFEVFLQLDISCVQELLSLKMEPL